MLAYLRKLEIAGARIWYDFRGPEMRNLKGEIAMQRKIYKAVLLSAFLGTTALAETPAPNYLELSYSTGDIEFGVDGLGSEDIDQDGFKLEGSFVAGELALLRASYASLSGDESGLDLDTDTLIAGAGYLFSAGENTVIDVGLEYRTDDLKLSDCCSSISDDVNGLGLSAGVRSWVNEKLELYARASYLEGDYEGGLALDLSGTLYVTEQFGVSLGFEYLDADDEGVSVELSQFVLGGRFSF